MLRAYDVLYDILENLGQAPRLNKMDNNNEAYTALKRLLQKKENSGAISVTTWAQKKCIRACYPHFQESVCGRVSVSRQQLFNIFVVLDGKTSINHD